MYLYVKTMAMQVYDGNFSAWETEPAGTASAVGGGAVCVLGRLILPGGPHCLGRHGPGCLCGRQSCSVWNFPCPAGDNVVTVPRRHLVSLPACLWYARVCAIVRAENGLGMKLLILAAPFLEAVYTGRLSGMTQVIPSSWWCCRPKSWLSLPTE